MRRPIAALLVFALVAAPAVAVAQGGQGKGGGRGGQSSVSQSTKQTDREAGKAERFAAKNERKAQRESEKVARKAQRRADKVGREADRPADADEATGSSEPARSVEGTRQVGPGVSRAFSRITANLEKSLAKVADGRKKQLPPGLLRVWLKFAGWLGVDPSTIPALPRPIPTAAVQPTSTVEPTATVQPTTTVEPTATPTP